MLNDDYYVKHGICQTKAVKGADLQDFRVFEPVGGEVKASLFVINKKQRDRVTSSIFT
jgi:hypothetical protein